MKKKLGILVAFFACHQAMASDADMGVRKRSVPISSTIYTPPPRNLGPVPDIQMLRNIEPAEERCWWDSIVSNISDVGQGIAKFLFGDDPITVNIMPHVLNDSDLSSEPPIKSMVMEDDSVISESPTTFKRTLSQHWTESDLELGEISFIQDLVKRCSDKTPTGLFKELDNREDAFILFKYLSLQEKKQNIDFTHLHKDALIWMIDYLRQSPGSLKNLVKIRHDEFSLTLKQTHELFERLCDDSLKMLEVKPTASLDPAMFVAMASRYTQKKTNLFVLIDSASLPYGYEEFKSPRLRFMNCTSTKSTSLSEGVVAIMRKVATEENYQLKAPDGSIVYLQK